MLTILLALVFIRKLRADGDHTVVNVINLFDIKDHVRLSGLIPEYCNAGRRLNNFFLTPPIRFVTEMLYQMNHGG